MDIEDIKFDILREAGRHGNQIYKLKKEDGEFVKVKRGYSHPQELREKYLSALDDLIESGLVNNVFSNRDLELFEVADKGSFQTPRSAQERIVEELESGGRVYKIHSDRGEFVQCGKHAIDGIDAERVLFIQALHELSHHGVIQVVSENHVMANYRLSDRGSIRFRQGH